MTRQTGNDLERRVAELERELALAQKARDAYQDALHDNYRKLRAENDHFREALNRMAVLLKDGDGNIVDLGCALCGCAMHVNPEPVQNCMWCKRDRMHEKDPTITPARPHVHVRCNACSPTLWWGLVPIKEKIT